MIALTLALAGCAPGTGANQGPYHEWFNPDGKRVGDNLPAQCPAGEVPGLPAVIPPLSVPAGVAEGYAFATIDLRIDALVIRADGEGPVTDLCIPVGVHAYVNVGGTNAPITTIDRGIVVTPWDAIRNTPYSATGLLAWRVDRGSAPVVNIDWSAKYLADVDLVDRSGVVVGLACSVYLNGVVISRTISVNVDREAKPLPGAQGGQAVTGPFVQCRPDAFTPRPAL